ncbi:MAG: sigma 54-interacting transcriptional regulator [Phycisphaerae bacterium]|nr:sigma 54-interacting transcriptional regulator [Phycisphaerae bacterium]
MTSTRDTGTLSLEALLEHTMDGIFVMDSARRFLVFNAACERITGYSRNEVIGSQCDCSTLLECADEQGRSLPSTLCPGLQVFRGEVPSARQRLRLRRKDGSFAWVETHYTMLKNGGETGAVLAVMRDVSETKQTEAELRAITENLREEVSRLRADIQERYGFSNLISHSRIMNTVFEKIRAACNNSSAVLICGQPGAGKELIARTIHHNGLQKEGRFVPLNCSALSKDQLEAELFGYAKGSGPQPNMEFQGLLRAAAGGTLFLDELTEMPVDTQAKLARALQDGRVRPFGSTEEYPVNVRVIASTPQGVSDAVASGWLRRDLYYLLSVITIEAPTLHERKEDIPFLVEHFVSEFNRQSLRQVKSIHPLVWPALLQYDWPGNVRELRNAIESAIAVGSGPELKVEDLPNLVRGDTVEIFEGDKKLDLPLDDVLASVERRAILSALRRAGGQRSRAARAMGVSRSRLYRRMEALGIHPREDL